jgi:hypothetical protein
MLNWITDISVEVKTQIAKFSLEFFSYLWSLKYYFVLALFAYVTFLLLRKVWHTETAQVIRQWAKVTLFMIGLSHVVWSIYTEVAIHLVAYNIVEKLPYVEMHLE